MNIDTLRKSGYIIFEAVTGSKAYKLDVIGSDTDIRGLFVLPTEEILAGRYIEQVSDNTNDTTFYEVGRFIELASKGNPNVLEILNSPERCIIYKDDRFDKWFSPTTLKKFITTKLRHTFSGYGYSQIKKAKGLNKKMNWDKEKFTRKNIVDFCYVLDGPKSILMKEYFKRFVKYPDLNLKNCGVVKTQNVRDMYCLYLDTEKQYNLRGILNDEGTSSAIRLSSIPKELAENQHPITFGFNEDGWKCHCREYREYQEWVENRNESRYTAIGDHGQGIDGKNLLHLVRLLKMAKEIGSGQGIIVERNEEDRKELLDIRMGKVDLQSIIDNADQMMVEINEAFDNSNLPKSVSTKFRQNLIEKIRLESFLNHTVTKITKNEI